MDKYRKVIDNVKQSDESIKDLHKSLDVVIGGNDVEIEKYASFSHETPHHYIRRGRAIKVVASVCLLFVASVVMVSIFTSGKLLPRNLNSSSDVTPENTSEPNIKSLADIDIYKTANDNIETVLMKNTKEAVPGTKEGVSELFEEGGLLYDTDYSHLEDKCSNITPDVVKDKIGSSIFHLETRYGMFIVHNDEITKLGTKYYQRLVNIQVCDFDGDGRYELLITYFNESAFYGMPYRDSVTIELFDPETKDSEVLFVSDFSPISKYIGPVPPITLRKVSDSLFAVYKLTDLEDEYYIANYDEENYIGFITKKDGKVEAVIDWEHGEIKIEYEE